MIKITHIDDDPIILEQVKRLIHDTNFGFMFEFYQYQSSQEFFKDLPKHRPAILILDVNLEDGDLTGIEICAQVSDLVPECKTLICSSQTDLNTIARCIKNGAKDFISKKSIPTELTARVLNLMSPLTPQQAPTKDLSIYAGETLSAVKKRIPNIINSAITSLFISGESGTGKEAVVDIISGFLPEGMPLVKINCGAINPNLIESELFGHLKGAFTGATSNKVGLIKKSNGGFIFLDEVATLSTNAQVALLRVIENQELLPVGADKSEDINVRFISATNEDVPQLIEKGKFRNDLWQRLNESRIDLPPLRERPSEIEYIAESFVKTMRGGPYSISPTAMTVLKEYHWGEGNIRQLRNCLRAMTEKHINKVLPPISIPSYVWDGLDAESNSDNESNDPKSYKPSKIELTIQAPVDFSQICCQLFIRTVEEIFKHEGAQSIRSLARQIGMSRTRFTSLCEQAVSYNLVSNEELNKWMEK